MSANECVTNLDTDIANNLNTSLVSTFTTKNELYQKEFDRNFTTSKSHPLNSLVENKKRNEIKEAVPNQLHRSSEDPLSNFEDFNCVKKSTESINGAINNKSQFHLISKSMTNDSDIVYINDEEIDKEERQFVECKNDDTLLFDENAANEDNIISNFDNKRNFYEDNMVAQIQLPNSNTTHQIEHVFTTNAKPNLNQCNENVQVENNFHKHDITPIFDDNSINAIHIENIDVNEMNPEINPSAPYFEELLISEKEHSTEHDGNTEINDVTISYVQNLKDKRKLSEMDLQPKNVEMKNKSSNVVEPDSKLNVSLFDADLKDIIVEESATKQLYMSFNDEDMNYYSDADIKPNYSCYLSEADSKLDELNTEDIIVEDCTDVQHHMSECESNATSFFEDDWAESCDKDKSHDSINKLVYCDGKVDELNADDIIVEEYIKKQANILNCENNINPSFDDNIIEKIPFGRCESNVNQNGNRADSIDTKYIHKVNSPGLNSLRESVNEIGNLKDNIIKESDTIKNEIKLGPQNSLSIISDTNISLFELNDSKFYDSLSPLKMSTENTHQTVKENDIFNHGDVSNKQSNYDTEEMAMKPQSQLIDKYSCYSKVPNTNSFTIESKVDSNTPESPLSNKKDFKDMDTSSLKLTSERKEYNTSLRLSQERFNYEKESDSRKHFDFPTQLYESDYTYPYLFKSSNRQNKFGNLIEEHKPSNIIERKHTTDYSSSLRFQGNIKDNYPLCKNCFKHHSQINNNEQNFNLKYSGKTSMALEHDSNIISGSPIFEYGSKSAQRFLSFRKEDRSSLKFNKDTRLKNRTFDTPNKMPHNQNMQLIKQSPIKRLPQDQYYYAAPRRINYEDEDTNDFDKPVLQMRVYCRGVLIHDPYCIE